MFLLPWTGAYNHKYFIGFLMFLLCMLSWCVHGTFACKLSPLISYVHVGLDQVINIYVIMSLGTFVVHVLYTG